MFYFYYYFYYSFLYVSPGRYGEGCVRPSRCPRTVKRIVTTR